MRHSRRDASLSALVRSVILESAHAADEAVVVKPAFLKPQQPRQTYEENLIDQARKLHAQVDSEIWREKALRTFSFIDKHSDVRDVVVIPVAMARLDHDPFPIRGRLAVLTADQAQNVFGSLGVPEHAFNPQDITIVPVVGQLLPSLVKENFFLPTTWMTVHAIFDSDTDVVVMKECSIVINELMKIIGIKRSLGLLINCSWGENSHALAKAVASHMGPFRDAVKKETKPEGFGKDNPESPLAVASDLLSRMPSPKLAHRLDPSKPIVPNMSKVSDNQFKRAETYFFNSPRDVAAEIMTIAVVKPKELQPRFDLIPSFPEWVLYMDAKNGAWHDEIGSPSGEEFFDKIERIRELIREDMESLQQAVSGLREKFVADLRGKAVFVRVL